MEGRKWEELEVDCLVNVIKRVGMESLLLHVPFVCKSWYQATRNSLCWSCIEFPSDFDEFDYYDEETFKSRFMKVYKLSNGDFTAAKFIKSTINRSCRNAKSISLPDSCTAEVMNHIGDECPGLDTLLLPQYCMYMDVGDINICINKLKHLEFLRLGIPTEAIPDILNEISIHCKNFTGLYLPQAVIGEEEASSIVASVPNIKYLSMKSAQINREDLLTILEGCKKLESLDVRDCIGFDVDDEILKLADHIDKFMYEGAVKEVIGLRELFLDADKLTDSMVLQLAFDIRELPEDD